MVVNGGVVCYDGGVVRWRCGAMAVWCGAMAVWCGKCTVRNAHKHTYTRATPKTQHAVHDLNHAGAQLYANTKTHAHARYAHVYIKEERHSKCHEHVRNACHSDTCSQCAKAFAYAHAHPHPHPHPHPASGSVLQVAARERSRK
jgi:hypothetical protein